MQTFFCDEDYRAYLSLLGEWCDHYEVSIWAYCLMPNHVHTILVPAAADGLARAVGETHRRYTRRVNFRQNWRGHLWQERFASFVMDESHLLAAARYVERNPLKAGLVASPADWPWSSATAHVAGSGDAVAAGDWLVEPTAGWVCTWGEYLLDRDEVDLAAAMRLHGSTGRPMGEEGFIKKLERRLARKLLPAKPGRPKKAQK